MTVPMHTLPLVDVRPTADDFAWNNEQNNLWHSGLCSHCEGAGAWDSVTGHVVTCWTCAGSGQAIG